jgi:hypothetical protein
MFSRFLLIVLLAAVAQARGATEPQGQGAVLKGTVILNGEGGQGVANVQSRILRTLAARGRSFWPRR